MNKDFAKSKIATVASKQGYTVQTRAGKDCDDIRILNASREVVASGTLALDTKGGYVASDISTVISQIQTKLHQTPKRTNASRRPLNSGCHGKKMNSSRRKMNASVAGVPFRTLKAWADSETDEDYEKLTNFYYDTWLEANPEIDPDEFAVEDFIDTVYNCDTEQEFKESIKDYIEDLDSSRRAVNAACRNSRKVNASEDAYVEDDDEFVEDDAEFVEDVESIVTDEQGNEIAVDEMLVVQDPETKEISLFVPEDEEDTVPENVEVIGEVTAAEDSEVLDSSRHFIKRSVRASRKRNRR